MGLSDLLVCPKTIKQRLGQCHANLAFGHGQVVIFGIAGQQPGASIVGDFRAIGGGQVNAGKIGSIGLAFQPFCGAQVSPCGHNFRVGAQGLFYGAFQRKGFSPGDAHAETQPEGYDTPSERTADPPVAPGKGVRLQGSGCVSLFGTFHHGGKGSQLGVIVH